MKRYRISFMDFDTRVESLRPIQDQWEEKAKKHWARAREQTILNLKRQYGEQNSDAKIKNFIDIDQKPFSVSAFHNKFLEQIRNSYVVGGYYPALTGACALGERILNQMIILLRDYYKSSPMYKKIYNKNSFDNWPLAIKTLESWNELLPDAVAKFKELNVKRNQAIHFKPETDNNDKELALEAILLLQSIVNIQFSAFGVQPWYFSVHGEIYIKKKWEDNPQVKLIFVPNSIRVGPHHRVESIVPQWVVNDKFEYEDKEISDREFAELRKNYRKK